MNPSLERLPHYGVGLGYRKEMHADILSHAEHIDWLEIIADHYVSSLPGAVEETQALQDTFTLIPHGLETTIGSHEPLNTDYLDNMAELVKRVGAPFFSDHLCMTQAGGLELGQLTPLVMSQATADRAAERTRAVQERIGVPFLLENISRAFEIPGSELSELEFFNSVVEQADCGILLDLTNLFINASNFDYDPFDFIDHLPCERVVQVHLAGSERRPNGWLDTHSQPIGVHPEVWDLLEHLNKKCTLRAVMIERDQNYPEDFSEIVDDLDRARSFLG